MISTIGAPSLPQASPWTLPGEVSTPRETVDLRGRGPADSAWSDAQALRALAIARPAGGAVVGWMKGYVGGSPVDVTLDRRAQTVRGSAFGHTVRADVDDEQQTVKGESGGAVLDLKRTWTPDSIGLDGSWHGGSLQTALDWNQGTLTGSALGRPIDLDFSLQRGTVSGTFAGAPVDLQHDAISGRLRGTLAGQATDISITNRDLSDFLQNIHLFVK